MLAVSKVKMSGSEKESEWNRSTRNNNFVRAKGIKLVTREFHFVVVQKKKRRINVQVKCAAHAKFFGRLIRPTDFCFFVVFFFPFSLPSPLSIARFYICVSKLQV